MKMARHSKCRWGEWVETRSRVLGFRRFADLASEIGCTRQNLRRWFNMDEPPDSIRKGFDRKLAKVLRTSVEMLFNEWANTPPDEAPVLTLHRDHMPENWEQDQKKREYLERLLFGEMIPYLPLRDVEQLVLTVMTMGLHQEGIWALHFRKLANKHDVFKIFREPTVTSDPPPTETSFQVGGVIGEPVFIRDPAAIEQFLKEHPEARDGGEAPELLNPPPPATPQKHSSKRAKKK